FIFGKSPSIGSAASVSQSAGSGRSPPSWIDKDEWLAATSARGNYGRIVTKPLDLAEIE
ncbi:hypothetical protein RRG08_029853, partial [Elysia crispata]